MADRLDRTIAAAEARLDRLDDDAAEASPNGHVPDVDLSDGMHIEDEDELEVAPAAAGLTTDEILIELDGGPDAELTDCVEAFAEAFNARDLETLVELVAPDAEAPGLGNDLDNLPEAVEDLWERRPSSLLTRGELAEQCVAVMWELGDGGGWWRVATLHFDDCVDGQLGVVEFSDDPGILEEVETVAPDGDVDEGIRWEEWTEGTVEN
jgi:hypothetical protein